MVKQVLYSPQNNLSTSDTGIMRATGAGALVNISALLHQCWQQETRWEKRKDRRTDGKEIHQYIHNDLQCSKMLRELVHHCWTITCFCTASVLAQPQFPAPIL